MNRVMKLKKFKILNFRSIEDSGWIFCNDITSFVGENESGKSSLLQGLWKFNPHSNGEIEKESDVPVTLEESTKKINTLAFVKCVFEIDNQMLLEKLASSLGKNTESVKNVIVSRSFSGEYSVSFFNDLNQSEDNTIPVSGGIKSTILQNMPQFIYYPHFGTINTKKFWYDLENWNYDLYNWKDKGKFHQKVELRTFNLLLKYVGFNLEELLKLSSTIIDNYNTDNKENATTIREILLKNAAEKITNEFKNVWKQNTYKFRFAINGKNFSIWVSDEKNHEDVLLENRSAGLQWFFNFYAVFTCEKEIMHKNCIILLDEAGHSLHPLTQKDLLDYFETISKDNQLLYTTHSPFLVNQLQIDQTRVVYLDKATGFTKVSDSFENINKKSVYALQAAIGLSVWDVLLLAIDLIIVQNNYDQFYLNAIKAYLIKRGLISPSKDIVFYPVVENNLIHGSKKIKLLSDILTNKQNLPKIICESVEIRNNFFNLLEKEYSGNENLILSINKFFNGKIKLIEDLIPSTLFANVIKKIYLENKINNDVSFKDEKTFSEVIEPKLKELNLLKKERVLISKKVSELILDDAYKAPENIEKQWVKLFDFIVAKSSKKQTKN